MRIGGLGLFQKTNSKGHINLAAYHSPHSLTWSWILSVSFSGAWRYDPAFSKRRGLRFGFSSWRNNYGRPWVLCLPWVAIEWHVQRPMWFRDLHARSWEEAEQLKAANRKLRLALSQAKTLATAPPEGRA